MANITSGITISITVYFVVAKASRRTAGRAIFTTTVFSAFTPSREISFLLLQIIPIVTGVNRHIAPAVICIALMLILVSSLVIFRGRMLRTAVTKYLHI